MLHSMLHSVLHSVLPRVLGQQHVGTVAGAKGTERKWKETRSWRGRWVGKS